MSEYEVLLSPEVAEFLAAADEKTERIVRDHLAYLEENPYPGRGRGNKEGLPIDGTERYRMHISQTWTALYDIYEDDDEVGVLEIVPIDEAHKRYGY
jgi:mRNA-degrading endonuclease RelE of RelBE toxin-antitoxin system